jgi:excisionase family DNA binding protein
MQDMHTRQRLLTARDLQHMLGVDTSTVYRMAADGRLPAVKIGRQWRFPLDQITARFGAVPTERTTDRRHLVQSIIEFGATALGVMMVLADMEGRPLTPVANPCQRFVDHIDDPQFVARCAAEWADMADDPDLAPRFVLGETGFACARSFIRSGDRLTAMVLAGGLACDGDAGADLHHLTDDERHRVLATLPRLAALLSNVALPLPVESIRRSS